MCRRRLGSAWASDVEASDGVTKREREAFYYFNYRPNKIIYFFLALMNSAHLSIDVHCSSGAKKNRFSSTAGASFWCLRS